MEERSGRVSFAMIGWLIAAALLWSASCASNPRRVRIAIGGQTQMVYLPTTLAEALGFYKLEGLDVELQDFEGGSKALQALVGGSADVVSGYYDHTIQMAAEGRSLVAFVTMLRYPGLVLVTSPEASNRVTTVSALAGGVVGVTSVGSSSNMFLTFLLTRNKMPVDSVSVTAIGSSATAVAAVERGRVAAGWVADPSFTIIRKRNPNVRVLADLRDEHGTNEAFGTPTYPGAVLYANTSWVRDHRDTALGLTRAIVRTLRWMHEHSEMEIAEKTPAAIRGENIALYAEALKSSRAIFTTDGAMTADGARAVHAVLAASMEKVRTASVDLSKTFTNDFVDAR
jgi:NitT/TauT family transport system substrate-binding protein